MTNRYTLVNQLSWLGEAEGRPTVVTMQRWDCLRCAKRRSDLVILNDGVVVSSQRCISEADLAYMDGVWSESLREFGPDALTEETVRNLIAERTGTRLPGYWCNNRGCGAQVPLGANRCGQGHTYNQTGSGSGHRLPAGKDIVLTRGGA